MAITQNKADCNAIVTKRIAKEQKKREYIETDLAVRSGKSKRERIIKINNEKKISNEIIYIFFSILGPLQFLWI